MRRAAGLTLAAVALAGSLSGCETTAQESARLERFAHHSHLNEHGLSITRQSADIHVLDAVLVRGVAGAAAVVTLRNDSDHTLTSVPIAITVRDARRATLFQNNAPGLEPALTSLASLPAHSQATWVNDQVPASGVPASVSAIVGNSRATSEPAPQLEVQGVHPSDEGGSASAAGTVHNRSNVTQQNLVVYVLARRAGRIVAAGRAVLPEVAAGASVAFQAFLVGAPHGAQLQASAPAATLG